MTIYSINVLTDEQVQNLMPHTLCGHNETKQNFVSHNSLIRIWNKNIVYSFFLPVSLYFFTIVILRAFDVKTNRMLYYICTYFSQSLTRWRRMHTRACVDDLKKALLSVKRKDIVDLIEEDITKRASKPSIPSPAFRTVRFPKVKT